MEKPKDSVDHFFGMGVGGYMTPIGNDDVAGPLEAQNQRRGSLGIDNLVLFPTKQQHGLSNFGEQGP